MKFALIVGGISSFIVYVNTMDGKIEEEILSGPCTILKEPEKIFLAFSFYLWDLTRTMYFLFKKYIVISYNE